MRHLWSRAFARVAALRILAMPPGQIRWPTSGAWRETPHWPHRLARRNSLRSLRELRSDNRRENDGRCALRAPPVPLRFSAAHKARPRRTARAFAGNVAACACRVVARVGTVVACAGDAAALGPNATDLVSRQPSAGCGGAGPSAPAATGEGQSACSAVCGAEQRSVGVGARSAHRTSDLRRCV